MVLRLPSPDRTTVADGNHAALVTGGVRGYRRQALDDDYRLAVLLNILRRVRQATNGIPASI